MASTRDNPFAVTKAVDFSDQEIESLWVDPGAAAEVAQLAKPKSTMAMFITGGKGSGKTHLMRHLAFSNQLLRSDNSPETVDRDGYLGIYVRFSGLNASRFQGKKQTAEAWSDVFAYYVELWLGQLLVETLTRVLDLVDCSLSPSTLTSVEALFTSEPSPNFTSLSELGEHLTLLQRRVDHAVNNCSLTGELNVEIHLTQGDMVFRAASILAESIPALRKVPVIFLLDEFENLSEEQQRYINTLVREREKPVTFSVGVKTYGIRTWETLSAGEALREGSEFERLRLDDRFRKSLTDYQRFCRSLVRLRLSDLESQEAADEVEDTLPISFEMLPTERLLETQTEFARSAKGPRKHLEHLRAQLTAALGRRRIAGVSSATDIERVVSAAECERFPLLEKAGCLVLYRAWANNEDLISTARILNDEIERSANSKVPRSEIEKVLDKFSYDLLAQLRRQYSQPQVYAGFETFVRMSAGLPRNLLVILKEVSSWALFRGEAPFSGGVISLESQRLGVSDAAEWFLRDARIPGPDGIAIHTAIQRLAELFRAIRFSDKPSECSLNTFSVNLGATSASTNRLVETAENWSLLLRIPRGQRDKNSLRVDDKFQLNPMLSPLWDLPTARRGTLALDPADVEAIFAREGDAFSRMRDERVARMQAPFRQPESQDGFPGFDA